MKYGVTFEKKTRMNFVFIIIFFFQDIYNAETKNSFFLDSGSSKVLKTFHLESIYVNTSILYKIYN